MGRGLLPFRTRQPLQELADDENVSTRGRDHASQNVRRIVLAKTEDAADSFDGQFTGKARESGQPGVEVVEVAAGSAAAAAGISAGMVLYSINNLPVRSDAEVKAALAVTTTHAHVVLPVQ